jgi:hypothetical protein
MAILTPLRDICDHCSEYSTGQRLNWLTYHAMLG